MNECAEQVTPHAPIRVVVADDQSLVRSGLVMLLKSSPGFEVVGEAADGAEAIQIARAVSPDVILMDVRMPEVDGIQATRAIVSDPSMASARVLVLTTFDLDEYVFEALRSGASGFLLKDTDPDDLLEAVRLIAAGEALLAPSVTRRVIAEFAKTPAVASSAATDLDQLTEREVEVLALVGRGLSNAEIGEALFISPATAKTHVSHVMLKLGARDRAQLVVTAYESGLIAPGAAGD